LKEEPLERRATRKASTEEPLERTKEPLKGQKSHLKEEPLKGQKSHLKEEPLARKSHLKGNTATFI